MDHSEVKKEEAELEALETEAAEEDAAEEAVAGEEAVSGAPADEAEEGAEEAADETSEDASDEDADSEADAGESDDSNVEAFPVQDPAQQLRMVEALLFAAAEPLDRDSIAARLPEGADVGALIEDLQALYAERGVNLVRVANKWMFRTAEDLSFLMRREAKQQKKLSRAALETLAIIAYHQPVTRAEIEEIRGVSVSKGTVDVLMETGWVRLRGRRRVPGRPVTYGTTEEFLVHFGLENISDLPGLDELKASGMLEGHLPPGFEVPVPSDTGGDGDGEFDDDPLHEEYGEALDDHVAQSASSEGEDD